jgi:hypothetical protein
VNQTPLDNESRRVKHGRFRASGVLRSGNYSPGAFAPQTWYSRGAMQEERPMRLPRLGIARLMVFVAYVALNLGVIRALYDGFWEDLLFDALPTVNILVLMSIAGFRRHRMRAFALGFVVIGAASLLALQMWAREDGEETLHRKLRF